MAYNDQKTAYRLKLQDPRWKSFRQEVLARDKNTCCRCKTSNGILDAHHLYYEWGNEPWQYPLEAMATLCRPCHVGETKERKEMFNRLNNAMIKARMFSGSVELLAFTFENCPPIKYDETVAYIIRNILLNERAINYMLEKYPFIANEEIPTGEMFYNCDHPFHYQPFQKYEPRI